MADAVLSADGGQFGPDTPSLTASLKGLGGCQVNLRTANTDLHSGMFGAKVPNAVQSMVQLAASFHDKDGRIAIDGFYDDVVDLTDEERAEIALVAEDEEALKARLDIDSLWGEPGWTAREREWGRPTLDLNGIWGGFQGDGIKTVTPSEAHLKITCRLVPNQTPEGVIDKIREACRGESAARLDGRGRPASPARPSRSQSTATTRFTWRREGGPHRSVRSRSGDHARGRHHPRDRHLPGRTRDRHRELRLEHPGQQRPCPKRVVPGRGLPSRAARLRGAAWTTLAAGRRAEPVRPFRALPLQQPVCRSQPERVDFPERSVPVQRPFGGPRPSKSFTHDRHAVGIAVVHGGTRTGRDTRWTTSFSGWASGASLVLVGWLLRELGPRIRDRAPAEGTVLSGGELVLRMAWARFCGTCGMAMLLCGLLILLVTGILTVASAGDDLGTMIVLGTFGLSVVLMLLWTRSTCGSSARWAFSGRSRQARLPRPPRPILHLHPKVTLRSGPWSPPRAIPFRSSRRRRLAAALAGSPGSSGIPLQRGRRLPSRTFRMFRTRCRWSSPTTSVSTRATRWCPNLFDRSSRVTRHPEVRDRRTGRHAGGVDCE